MSKELEALEYGYKELNKNYQTINGRIQKGWQPKIALLVPKNVRKGGKQYEQIVASIN